MRSPGPNQTAWRRLALEALPSRPAWTLRQLVDLRIGLTPVAAERAVLRLEAEGLVRIDRSGPWLVSLTEPDDLVGLARWIDAELEAQAELEEQSDPYADPDAPRGRLAWMDDAACLDRSELFFRPNTRDELRARALCAECSVIEQCRDWADEIEERDDARELLGIYAGESPAERAARRRRETADSSTTLTTRGGS